ncbi:hypothetical protein CPB83DRAFT_779953 [Crepidotus variabilis]|uniref:BTB domain-containing protein n=1 Tax=Crepidotus variabilis TaxID=179855 RepID=A0A9P6EUI8_9AGAR|nr:hypothetical protein CPB83DRAFT_779953 [Crepidotus variabilis]
MNSPGPTATDIQSHLYNSFIQGSTYDVAIRVTGNWTALYKLHRVVLIQSGFFRSLFTAGFVESKPNRPRSSSEEICVSFDDYNITRPAFEICISRLYGGGPSLFVSPNLIPTTNNPLGPPFSGILEPEDLPVGHQPASPRFLLSLLATSIYLSIPAVASQSLSLILKTVGPKTVLDYLNFACGKCFTYSNPLPEDTLPAVGLEKIAFEVGDDDRVDGQSTTKSIEGLKSTSSQISAGTGSPESEESEPEDLSHRQEPCYHYGTVSDKIGEACACWLARWATDMLPYEDINFILPDSRLRSKSVSSIISSKLSGSLKSTQSASTVPPLWGRGGLTAKWAATLVSADTLFVKNERERYNFAKSVVELRRSEGILEEEEVIWTEMFERGIHYVNMPFEDIHHIGQDISPTTRRPYVTISTLQASHWCQSVLKHAVTSRPYNPSSPATGTSSPPPRDKELGIALTTAEILSQLSNARPNDPERFKPYYPVFNDQSVRVGDGGTSAVTTSTGAILSMEELFSPFHNPAPRQPRAATAQEPIPAVSIVTTEDKFFGLVTPRMVAQDCINSDPNGKAKWSPYPPYRFSVEFWDVDLLKEKSRLHSQTIWYAGSLFNVYVQLVRKKGQAQLGIYLHRQSHVDPLPASSIPPTSRNPGDGTDNHHYRQPSFPSFPLPASPQIPNHYSPSIHPVTSRSGTPAQRNGTASSPPSPSSSPPIGSAPFILSASPSTLTLSPPQHNYRDPRTAISAYFSISCASATGSSQTRFSSSPDTFTVSQSWGWKSSSLRTEEFLELGTQALPSGTVRGKEVSLRATVVLGLV